MTEYEYKEKCQKINEQIKPSDEFTERMKTNIEQELQNRQNKQKCKFQKVAASFIAITLLSTGAVAFADDIGNLFTKIFKNSDPSINLAIENGYIQNVDMDYIEHDGIGIKVNSIIVDENKLDVILDVRGEDVDDAYFESIVLKENDNLNIDFKNNHKQSISFETKWKNIDKNNHMLIVKISNIEKNIIQTETLNLILDKMYIIKENDKYEVKNNKWDFLIDIDEEYFISTKNTEKFYIENADILEKYSINNDNTSMNITLNLKEEILKKYKINREDIIIKDENDKEYNCKAFSRINQDLKLIEMNIPLTVYNKIDKFKIFINLENEVIELEVKKQED